MSVFVIPWITGFAGKLLDAYKSQSVPSPSSSCSQEPSSQNQHLPDPRGFKFMMNFDVCCPAGADLAVDVHYTAFVGVLSEYSFKAAREEKN